MYLNSFCPFCNKEVTLIKGGGLIEREHEVCPYCKSMTRHRFLYYVYKDNAVFTHNAFILHFAPECCLHTLFNGITANYVCGGLEDKKYTNFKHIDATRTGLTSNSFDFIIANHVIEHIIEEELFLKEMHRLLKCNGKLFLSFPFYIELEMTLENHAYDTEELKIKYYGQKDHVRKYGCDVLKDRFTKYFNLEYIEGNTYFKNEDAINTNCFILTSK